MFKHLPIGTGVIDEFTNFKSFPTSFVLLLRLMTGAGWNDVLDALLEDNECMVSNFYYQK